MTTSRHREEDPLLEGEQVGYYSIPEPSPREEESVGDLGDSGYAASTDDDLDHPYNGTPLKTFVGDDPVIPDKSVNVPGVNPQGADVANPVPGANPQGADDANPVPGANPQGADDANPVPGANPQGANDANPVPGANPQGANVANPVPDANPQGAREVIGEIVNSLYVLLHFITLCGLILVVLFVGIYLIGINLAFIVSFFFSLFDDKLGVGWPILFEVGFLFLLPYLLNMFFWYAKELLVTEFKNVNKYRESQDKQILNGGLVLNISILFVFVAVVCFLIALVLFDKTWILLALALSIIILDGLFIIAINSKKPSPRKYDPRIYAPRKYALLRNRSTWIVILPVIISFFVAFGYSENGEPWLTWFAIPFFLSASLVLTILFVIHYFPAWHILWGNYFNKKHRDKVDNILSIHKLKCFKKEIDEGCCMKSSQQHWCCRIVLNALFVALAFSALISTGAFWIVFAKDKKDRDELRPWPYLLMSFLWITYLVILLIYRCIRCVKERKQKKDKSKKPKNNAVTSENAFVKFIAPKRKHKLVVSTVVTFVVVIILCSCVLYFILKSPEIRGKQTNLYSSPSALQFTLGINSSDDDVSLCEKGRNGFRWIDYAYMANIAYDPAILTGFNETKRGGAVIDEKQEIIISFYPISKSETEVYVSDLVTFETFKWGTLNKIGIRGHAPIFDGDSYVYLFGKSPLQFDRFNVKGIKNEKNSKKNPNDRIKSLDIDESGDNMVFPDSFSACYINKTKTIYAVDNKTGNLISFNGTSWTELFSVEDLNYDGKYSMKLLAPDGNSSVIYALTPELNGFWEINLTNYSINRIESTGTLPASTVLHESLLVSKSNSDFIIVTARNNGLWYQYQKSQNEWIELKHWLPVNPDIDNNHLAFFENNKSFFYHVHGKDVWTRVYIFGDSMFVQRYAAKMEDVLHYSEITSPLSNQTVVAFRGTNSKLDGLHDVNIFLESVIPSFATLYIPLPAKARAKFATFFACFGSFSWPSALNLVAEGKKKVEELKANEDVIVVGHSLGGALANIIGNIYQLQNFGLSPPGTAYGGEIYDFDDVDVTKYMHAVVPQRDPVASLGSTHGTVIHIPCDEPKSLSCHYLTTTICKISSICGQDQDILSKVCKATK